MTTWNRRRQSPKGKPVPKLVYAPATEAETRAYKRAFRGVCGAMSTRELERGRVALRRGAARL